MNFDDYRVYNSFVDKVKNLISAEDYTKVASLLRKVLIKTPNDRAFQLFYVTALVGLNRIKEAKVWLKKIILKYEKSSYINSEINTYYYKGLYYFLEGEFNRSMEFLKECFSIRPDYFKKLLYDKAFVLVKNSDEFKKLCAPTKVFLVNDYISLRLMFSKTLIYVCNELFLSCQKIALSIAPNEFEDYTDFTDIDDAISFYKSHTQTDGKQISVSPEEEFWGHCSNLQAWVENDYNTCVLSKNISFPLLKELFVRGIKRFTPIFKRELIERIKIGGNNILSYFLHKNDTEENFLKHLTEEELLDNLVPFEEAEIIKNISKFIPLDYTITINLGDTRDYYPEFRDDEKMHFYIENNHIIELEILLNWMFYTEEYHQTLLEVKNLKHLKELAVYITINICGAGQKRFLKTLYNFENLDCELSNIKRSTLEEFEN